MSNEQIPFANVMLWDYAECLPAKAAMLRDVVNEIYSLTQRKRDEVYTTKDKERLAQLARQFHWAMNSLNEYPSLIEDELAKLLPPPPDNPRTPL